MISQRDTEPKDDDDDESLAEQQLQTLSFGALVEAQEEALLRSPAARRKKDRLLRPTTTTLDQQPSRAKDILARPGRANKNAPTEISSKRAVGRKREVVVVPKRPVRDPRFDGLSGGRLDEDRLRRDYAFLDRYREDEMGQLRQAIKSAEDEEIKVRLKRELSSMVRDVRRPRLPLSALFPFLP